MQYNNAVVCFEASDIAELHSFPSENYFRFTDISVYYYYGFEEA